MNEKKKEGTSKIISGKKERSTKHANIMFIVRLNE